MLLLLLLLVPLAVGEVEKQYKIDLHYSFGNLVMESITIVPAEEEIVDRDLYAAEIVSFDNEILSINFFTVPLEIFWDGVNEEGEIDRGGQIILNETDLTIFVPYYENAQEINLYNPDLKLLETIDVTRFSKDVPTSVVEDEAEDVTTVGGIQQDDGEIIRTILWPILIVVVLLIVILVIVIVIKRKNEK